MLYGLGLILFTLGLVSADSENIIVPFAMILMGSLMVMVAKKKGGAK